MPGTSSRQHPNSIITRLSLPLLIWICAGSTTVFSAPAPGGDPVFTKLEPLPPPAIVEATTAYPGGQYEAANLVDGNSATEYSSASAGTNTFVVFDFGKPVRILAFEHTDRNDPATVAESTLTFLDAAGRPTAENPVTVKHANGRNAVSFFALTEPVTAQRVRWQITKTGAGFGTVGGAEIRFFTAAGTDAWPAGLAMKIQPLPLIERTDAGPKQPVQVQIFSPYVEKIAAQVRFGNTPAEPIPLSFGQQTTTFRVPAAAQNSTASVHVDVAGRPVISQTVEVKPAKKYQIYLLPHSHVDIGYTALQADVEKKQNENLEIGMRLARQTANYPEGSRFKWNAEVLWPIDNYLRTATPEKKAALLQAIRSGQIGLDAFYCNILTGLCRPEELLMLMRYACTLSDLCGVPVQSAMISDVPGYTWSTVTAMAQAGVKYFSFAPNYFDRMGGTMKEWQNRPFWWRAADGQHRVLCWCPSRGYALGHIIGDGEALAKFMPDYLHELETNSYPYEISHLRWNVHGDNGSPDEKIAAVVREWNQRYLSPRLILSTTAEAFKAFESRYGDKLPEYSGDYTPYWEDGAASSARETAMNRASAERLVQAETIWAMRNPGLFPASDFNSAWRNILLYSEHTWGAHNSISQPDLPFVRDQWKVKQGFAVDADHQTREFLARALAGSAPAPAGAIDVFNTSSWKRTGLVTLTAEASRAGDRVVNAHGKTIPSQRLSTGELVFVAQDVPAFGAVRFVVRPGTAQERRNSLKVEGVTLSNSELAIRIDEATGGIASLYSKSLRKELLDKKSTAGLNDYFYLPGKDLSKIQRNGRPVIRMQENGPLVASLSIESEAPGCNKLTREIRLVNGLDLVELINTVDKKAIREKEGIHFGYGFDVPEGTLRMDVGWAMVRPEVDQIPASCKNWFSVQRWLDISNQKYGITWVPIDAPLVEIGDITANLIGSQTDWRVWIQHLLPSQTIYSWVMNNHWHTNYRAEQEGPTVFRYFIRAHGQFDPEQAARFGSECSQPLIAAPASGPIIEPPVRLSGHGVIVSTMKPGDDGQSRIVRLFGAGGQASRVTLNWSEPEPKDMWLSDTGEHALKRAERSIEVPPWGLITIKAK